VDLVKDTRHADEDSRFECRDVVDEGG
jgi:hypothetical protein